MKETIEFETIHDIEGAAIAIERTPDFFQMAQQLSEFIYATGRKGSFCPRFPHGYGV